MSQSQIGSLTVSDDNYDKKSTEEDIYPNRKKESSTSAGHESTQTIADVGYEKESEGDPITKKHHFGEKQSIDSKESGRSTCWAIHYGPIYKRHLMFKPFKI